MKADAGGEATASQGVGESESGKTVVDVTCLQDAQDYLKEEYGIPNYKVRTIALVRAAGAERDVEFKFPE